MNDPQLLRGLKSQEPEAFQQLCDHYMTSIWRFVFHRVDGDPHLAEDIVSETMLALVKACRDPSLEIDSPAAWLRRVAQNKLRDHFRSAARIRHLLDGVRKQTEEADWQDPCQLSQRKERRLEVREALEQLTEQHRLALEWKYLDKISVREMSRRWATTEKAVESILFRARRELRNALQPAVTERRRLPTKQESLALD